MFRIRCHLLQNIGCYWLLYKIDLLFVYACTQKRNGKDRHLFTKMKQIYYLFAAASLANAALLPLCNNPSLLDKACDKVDLSKYLGGWNEIGRTAIIRNTFERNCNCVSAEYSLKSSTIVNVINKCVNTTSNELSTIQGTATVVRPGRLNVSFGSQSTGGNLGSVFQSALGPNYNILNVWTDETGTYKRALVTYGKFLPTSLQFTWILSRDKDVGQDEIKSILDYAYKAGFKPVTFEKTPCNPGERDINPGF
jgi:apolipoprotein D and lipocalin family protein